MPYKNNYPSVLAKKLACREQAFWPYISTCLALRLNNALIARKINIFPILDEIALLEGAPLAKKTGTKPATRFSGPHLGRFWHKHWTSAAFIEENLLQQWWGPYAERNGLAAKIIREAFEATGKPYGSDLSEAELWEVVSRMSSQMVSEGYRRRSDGDRLTGEWLIYYIHNGQNYYLDIASHTEGVDDGRLLKELHSSCGWEFPFAFAD